MDARTPNGHTSCQITIAGAATDAAWSYYGNTEYEGNFAADIDALASEVYPSMTCTTSTSAIPYSRSFEARGIMSLGGDASAESVYADTTASLMVNQGSTYHGLVAAGHNGQDDSHAKPSRCESETAGPSPLEMWMSRQERHDLFSYQGVQQPKQKSKAVKGRSDASTKKKSRC